VLAMPVSAFWMMNKNIDRLYAETDIRMLYVVAHAQSGDGVVQFSEKMHNQMGEVFVIDEVKKAFSEELDREGLAALKDLGKLS
jgi:hypothetical protein